jgi:hypothetical protein
MRTDLLDEFLVEEGTVQVRETIEAELAAGRADSRVSRCQLDFERFELRIDLARDRVRIVELMDPDRGTDVSLVEFERRLAATAPA